jgi:hypothetical protein
MKLQLIVFISSCKDSSRDFITFSRTTSGLYLNLMADIMEHLSLLRFSIDKLRRLVGLFISTLEELQWAMLLLIFINQRFQRLTRSDQIIPKSWYQNGKPFCSTRDLRIRENAWCSNYKLRFSAINWD